MPNDILASVSRLSDAELVSRLKSLAARERDVTAQLVAHLAELDTRDVYLREGYGSLFAYCRDALALSEHEAYNRIEAARAARRFPVILEMLAEGSVNLTTVRLLAPHLTPENHQTALESARGRRKSEVEEIVARLSPQSDVALSIRRLPAPKPASLLSIAATLDAAAPVAPALPALPSEGPDAADLVPPALCPRPSPPPVCPADVTPLAPGRYKVQLTISGDTLEKLRLAKDMLRHAIPSGDDAAILDRALTALLADLARKKFAAAGRPRPSREAAPESRHVPAEVKRTVWMRDFGRCAFVGTKGRRCAERGFLEFHHVRPYAAGGAATVDNIQLRCRRHNAYEARVYFGHESARGIRGFVREVAAPYGAPAPFDAFDHELVPERVPGPPE